jgi:hypothetical protein
MSDRSRVVPKKEHGIYLTRQFMEEPAWRAVSTKAQIIYLWVRLEWKGPKYNNNGGIRLSVRQAAKRAGIGVNAAAGAFRELQAKGFLVVTEMGALGVAGEARGPSFELTELDPGPVTVAKGRRLYREWAPGYDYPVVRHNANNPRGVNGKSNARHGLEDNPITETVPLVEGPIPESETVSPKIVTFPPKRRSQRS